MICLVLSLFSHAFTSNNLFGQRLNVSISKSYHCCSAAFTKYYHESERTKSSSEIKSIHLLRLL